MIRPDRRALREHWSGCMRQCVRTSPTSSLRATGCPIQLLDKSVSRMRPARIRTQAVKCCDERERGGESGGSRPSDRPAHRAGAFSPRSGRHLSCVTSLPMTGSRGGTRSGARRTTLSWPPPSSSPTRSGSWPRSPATQGLVPRTLPSAHPSSNPRLFAITPPLQVSPDRVWRTRYGSRRAEL